jgi:hypothetical protein
VNRCLGSVQRLPDAENRLTGFVPALHLGTLGGCEYPSASSSSHGDHLLVSDYYQRCFVDRLRPPSGSRETQAKRSGLFERSEQCD